MLVKEPREYQSTSLSKAKAALLSSTACTLVLPTGAGKTYIAALFILSVIAEFPDAKFLFLQHTDELLRQNMENIEAETGLTCSVVKGKKNDFSGQIVFASVPTLGKEKRLAKMPSFTHVIVDECHHACASTWLSILRHARDIDPTVRILGLTATRYRGDGQPLPDELGDIAYQVYIRDLVDLGYLVPMRAFSINVDDTMARLAGIEIANDDLAQSKVAKILNTPLFNEAVVKQWKAKAEGRPTIVYCSTIKHAQDVAQAFIDAGVKAVALGRNAKESAASIAAYRNGEVTVICQCIKLTEGFDYPPTSCIIILRAMNSANTFIQALGRALRIIDEAKFPGIFKTEAVCLDFSGAAIRHQQLDEATPLEIVNEAINTADNDNDDEEFEAEVAMDQPEPYRFDDVATNEAMDYSPELAERANVISEFKWEPLVGRKNTIMATGLQATAYLVKEGKKWVAMGQERDCEVIILGTGKDLAMFNMANAYIRSFEPDDRAIASRAWLVLEPSPAQRRTLKKAGFESHVIHSFTRYQATCHITFDRGSEQVDACIEEVRSLGLAA